MESPVASENILLDPYQSKSFLGSWKVAKKAIEKGHKSEEIYRVLSECEIQAGNLQHGFSICMNLAKTTQSFLSIRRLIYWFDRITSGFERNDGKIAVLIFEQDTIEELFEIIASGIEERFSTISNAELCEVVQRLGLILYNTDIFKNTNHSEFAERILKALLISRNSIVSTITTAANYHIALRWCSYFFAYASWIGEAEELMEKISAPYISKDQFETMPPGMVDRSEENKHKIILKNYDVPQIERTSRRLIRLTEGRSQLGRVLDVGCGTGMTSRLIRDRSDFIHGVDLDIEWLKEASSKNIFNKLDHANILDWDSKQSKFDTIVSSGVTNIIPQFGQFISKIESLLTKEGRAYIDVLTCSGSDGQRQIDIYVLRTREYIGQVIKDHGLRINYEHVGPNQFAVGTYMEIGRRK